MTTSGMTAPGAAAAWGEGRGRGRGGYGIIAFVSSGGGKVRDMPNCLNTVTADAQTHTNVQIRLSIHWGGPPQHNIEGEGLN